MKNEMAAARAKMAKMKGRAKIAMKMAKSKSNQRKEAK